MRDLLLEAAFAHPAVNEPLRVTTNPYTPDLRWPAQHLILEIDGSPWHDAPIAQQLDAEFEAAGERVLRTTRGESRRTAPYTDPQP